MPILQMRKLRCMWENGPRSQFSEIETAPHCAAPCPRKLRYNDQCCQMLAWGGLCTEWSWMSVLAEREELTPSAPLSRDLSRDLRLRKVEWRSWGSTSRSSLCRSLIYPAFLQMYWFYWPLFKQLGYWQSYWKGKWSESCSVVSDSLPPHGLYSPWDSPGQNTGVGCHVFLQGIFPTQGSKPGLPHCRRIPYQLSPQGNPMEGEIYY